MTRRELIALLGTTAAVWPLGARAQQPERIRRIGVLSIPAPDDPEADARNRVLEKTLHELGWLIGRDLQIDYRLAGGDDDRLRRYAAELVSLALNVILRS